MNQTKVDDLFNTKKAIKSTVATLKSGKESEFWQVMKLIVNENIKLLEENILEGYEGETQEDIRVKRAKLKAYKEVLNTPDDIIKKFEGSKKNEIEFDPY